MGGEIQMKNEDKIPYPSEQEIQRQINYIVQKGLPKRKFILHELLVLYKQIGFFQLLPKSAEWLFTIATLMIILFIMRLLNDVGVEARNPYYALLFMLSPFMFGITAYSSFFEKKETGTIELEMTMKHTVFHIIALRMLLFSGLAIVVNMSLSFCLAYLSDVDFIRIWLLSLTGLFLFAIGLLFAMRSGQIMRNMLGFGVLWLCGNSLLIFSAYTVYLQLLNQLPIIIYLGLVLLLVVLFCRLFNQLFLRKQEGIWLC